MLGKKTLPKMPFSCIKILLCGIMYSLNKLNVVTIGSYAIYPLLSFSSTLTVLGTSLRPLRLLISSVLVCNYKLAKNQVLIALSVAGVHLSEGN